MRVITEPLAAAITGDPAAFNCAASVAVASLMVVPAGTFTAFVNPPTPTDRVDWVKVGLTGSRRAGVLRDGDSPVFRLRDSAAAVRLLDAADTALTVRVPVALVAATV